MYKGVTTAVAALAVLGLLAGCAADPVDDTAPPAPPVAEAPTEHESGAAEPGEPEESASVVGVVAVDGVTYDITEVRACDPLNDGTVEREVELQGLGRTDGVRTQIDVYVQTVGGMPFDDVSWSGPEGIFGGPENAEVALVDGGSRVMGAAVLVDAMHQEDTIEIEFDLEVPTETINCR